ncbi:hypothetical protein Bca52824_097038 [Brassica carinata]|uniref:Uncharacterized protein n=1 Tax=Brassica carinata TaxID=52824 RepID=A0A8X7TG61_BRACI|nr:hypothetical protein Bca52824_097038 [Brassica carinata]
MSRESLLLSAEKPTPRERLVVSSASALGQKGMTTRKLEITAVSAEGLLIGGKPVKKNAFVAFDIAGNYSNWAMRTEVCGDYPVWKRTWRRSFTAGEERGFHVRFYGRICAGGLSYRLWDDYGKRNGIVNFSARIVPVSKPGLRPFWLR